MNKPTPASGPGSGPDAAKLLYSVRMIFVSAALFAVAGTVWLVSGNGALVGVLFIGAAVALAATGRAVSNRI